MVAATVCELRPSLMSSRYCGYRCLMSPRRPPKGVLVLLRGFRGGLTGLPMGPSRGGAFFSVGLAPTFSCFLSLILRLMFKICAIGSKLRRSQSPGGKSTDWNTKERDELMMGKEPPKEAGTKLTSSRNSFTPFNRSPFSLAW